MDSVLTRLSSDNNSIGKNQDGEGADVVAVYFGRSWGGFFCSQGLCVKGKKGDARRSAG